MKIWDLPTGADTVPVLRNEKTPKPGYNTDEHMAIVHSFSLYFQ